MNQHSGKKLSEVPFIDLAVGMEVVDFRSNNDGVIADLVTESRGKKINGVKIVYQNKVTESGQQSIFEHVKIK
jgi:hypothetical protein